MEGTGFRPCDIEQRGKTVKANSGKKFYTLKIASLVYCRDHGKTPKNKQEIGRGIVVCFKYKYEMNFISKFLGFMIIMSIIFCLSKKFYKVNTVTSKRHIKQRISVQY